MSSTFQLILLFHPYLCLINSCHDTFLVLNLAVDKASDLTLHVHIAYCSVSRLLPQGVLEQLRDSCCENSTPHTLRAAQMLCCGVDRGVQWLVAVAVARTHSTLNRVTTGSWVWSACLIRAITLALPGLEDAAEVGAACLAVPGLTWRLVPLKQVQRGPAEIERAAHASKLTRAGQSSARRDACERS